MTGKDIYEKYSKDLIAVKEEGRIKATAISLGEGFFATVSHPLQDPQSIKLINSQGVETDAEVLGWDNRYDLAVLKADWPIQAWESGDSSQEKPGAVLWSLGMDHHGARIHGGILAQKRDQKNLPMGGEISPSLEVDGTLTASMSGGPLFSEEGHFLGMNSLMPMGKGMTIPAQQLHQLAEGIKAKGNPEPGYMGITSTTAQTKEGQGSLLITAVEKDSPAEKAGLLVGDMVLSLNGESLEHSRKLFYVLRRYSSGEEIELQLQRAGNEMRIKLVLGSRK